MKNLIRLTLVAAALLPGLAMAAAPSLQVNPLKYQSTMLNNDIRDGYVDVANPSDTTLSIDASVQGFRQDDLAGDLSFFNNLAIQEAITLGITQFQLAPQEAVRVTFNVDPTKLPQGGTYAAIFFRTVPPQQSSSSSFVTESANVGTLLLLQNGPADAQIGKVTKFDIPFFQFGNGISGTAQYQNTNHSTAPVAFSPRLTSKVFPWGHATKLIGPYVLPGATRQFSVVRPGSYIGLVPISLVDGVSGVATTRWVVALTGIYAFAFIFLLCFVIVVFATGVRRNKLLFFRRKRPVQLPDPEPHVELLQDDAITNDLKSPEGTGDAQQGGVEDKVADQSSVEMPADLSNTTTEQEMVEQEVLDGPATETVKPNQDTPDIPRSESKNAESEPKAKPRPRPKATGRKPKKTQQVMRRDMDESTSSSAESSEN